MNSTVFDIETNGFTPTKIHCLSYSDGKEIVTLTSYDDMRKLLSEVKTLIGHNIHRYDVPVLERLLGVKFEDRLIDTLFLSWATYPTRKPGTFGLAYFGEDFGIPKPVIDDWEGLTIGEYVHRCEEDVKINVRLWHNIKRDLFTLYGDHAQVNRYIHYINNTKADCAREQEANPIKVDVVAAENLLSTLESLKQPKYDKLKPLMPKVPVPYTKTFPKRGLYNKDGQLSKIGVDWLRVVRAEGLPDDHKEPIKYIKSYKDGEPTTEQIKSWLFSLGWEPQNYESKKNSKDEWHDIPQLKNSDKEICESIVEMYEKIPELELLGEYLTICTRISMLKNKKEDGGLLINQENGYIKAKVGGLTNTLRYKHSKVVNLPKPSVPYGKEIRSLFICEEDEYMVGSDLSSLEDLTKQHYIYPYDPEYVNTMNVLGYDAHLSFGIFAKAITQEQSDYYKWYEKEFNDGTKTPAKQETEEYNIIKLLRYAYKTTNYSATYGVGAPTLSRRLKMILGKAKKLLNDYWDLNWSIRAFAKDQITKKCLGITWIYNPVSKFWYHLRANKDKFATLNSSTGVYVFDLWVTEVRKLGIKVRLSMHDEIMFTVKKIVPKERVIRDLKECIQKVNDRLALNRDMDISVDFGYNYSEVH